MRSNVEESLDEKMKKRRSWIISERRKKRFQKATNDTLDEIERIIIFHTYSKGGINHSELASLMGLNRRSLEEYIKKLIKSKKIVRKGERGHYSSNTVDTFDFDFSSFTLQKFFMAMNKINKVKNENIWTKDYYHQPFMDTSLEKWLFELSNKIGAFLLFLFIECMNPNNKFTTAGKYDDLLSGNLLSLKWARNSFTPMIDRLIYEFRDTYLRTMLDNDEDRGELIEMGLYAVECQECNNYLEHYSKKKLWESENVYNHIGGHHYRWYKILSRDDKVPTTEPTVRELYEEENLILTKNIVDNLKQKYKSVYPMLSSLFEKFMASVPKEIEDYKKQSEYFSELDEPIDVEIIRIRCKHRYSKILTVGKYQYKQCSKCFEMIPKNFKIGEIL